MVVHLPPVTSRSNKRQATTGFDDSRLISFGRSIYDIWIENDRRIHLRCVISLNILISTFVSITHCHLHNGVYRHGQGHVNASQEGDEEGDEEEVVEEAPPEEEEEAQLTAAAVGWPWPALGSPWL